MWIQIILSRIKPQMIVVKRSNEDERIKNNAHEKSDAEPIQVSRLSGSTHYYYSYYIHRNWKFIFLSQLKISRVCSLFEEDSAITLGQRKD